MSKEQEWLRKQLQDLTLQFEEVYKRKNGGLTSQEVFSIMEKAGFRGDENERRKIFQLLDENKDSVISKEEFQKAINRLPVASRREAALFRAFTQLDVDGSGTLSASEIREVATRVVGLTDDEVRAVYTAARFDENDGQISYDEFIRELNFTESESVLRNIFDRLDTDQSGAVSKEELLDALNQEGELARMRPYLTQVVDAMTSDGHAREITFTKFLEAWLRRRDFVREDRDSRNKSYV